jgi:hypothetical protein
MIDHADPPLADACPSLADATAIVPKVTSNVVINNSTRPLATPRGIGWKRPRSFVRVAGTLRVGRVSVRRSL